MMSPNESRESIKELFNDPRIPQQIDITDQVMKTIKQNKEGFFVKYKVSILVAIGLLASITTGYAAVQYYDLKNPQGDVIYQEKDSSKTNVKLVDELDANEEAYEAKRREVEENLAPGTAVVAYIVPNNPKQQVTILSSPFTFTDPLSMREKVANKVVVPETLPGGFAFKSGSVEFGIDAVYNKEALYQQAQTSKKEYVLLPLKLKDQFDYVNMTYKAGESYVDVYISNFEGMEDNTVYVVDPGNGSKVKLKVGEMEVLYSEEDRGDRVDKEIMWVMEVEGKKVRYEVLSSSQEFNKNNVEKFVKALLPGAK
ncbi:hypothetical protein [Brevibacillus sp. SIMBA_040]|uniref:hypothetical protein n=1 Tax=unclassified Brevibacillus TaxID=2684853 RepID=UPI00397A86C9